MPAPSPNEPGTRRADDGAELPLACLRQRLLDVAKRSRSGLFLYPLFWLAIAYVHGNTSLNPSFVLITALGLVIGAAVRYGLERRLAHFADHDFKLAQRTFAWASWIFQGYWGWLCAYVVGTTESDTVRWSMLMATVGLTAGASAIMAIDAPLARWYPPLLLGPTCVVLAFQGGFANWALATVFVLFFFYALKIVQLVSGDYEARQRAHLLLEQRAEELAVAHEHMRRLATYDDLTGLVNRRHMTLLLHHQAEMHRHGGDAFSIALIDLDHFKQINDAWSHAVGDKVLKGFADVARDVLHDSDIIARWGGEEFLILLPHTPDRTPEASLDQLRRQLADTPIAPGVPGLRLNFSGGLSDHRKEEAIEQTIDRADRGMYQAKADGRGRTERV